MFVGRHACRMPPVAHAHTCIAAGNAQILHYTNAQMVCRGIRRSWSVLGIRSMHVWTLNEGESVWALILLVFYCLFAYLHVLHTRPCLPKSMLAIQLLHILMTYAHEQIRHPL